jgi:hypothetical protein
VDDASQTRAVPAPAISPDAGELGGLSLADALSFCEFIGGLDPERYERCLGLGVGH